MHDNNCCCKPAIPPRGAQAKCPHCGASGKPVGTVTLKHIVKPEFLEEVTKPGFHFCPSVACELVYFHPDGAQLSKDDVRVRVGLKETEDPVPLCYCFGFTEAMALKEIESVGVCTIPERIAEEMNARRCACEIRNPQGSCCFGHVKSTVRRLIALQAKAIA